jgi:hypothetical protein
MLYFSRHKLEQLGQVVIREMCAQQGHRFDWNT